MENFSQTGLETNAPLAQNPIDSAPALGLEALANGQD